MTQVYVYLPQERKAKGREMLRKANGTPNALGNGMAAHNLAYIERQLRAGKTPEQLGGERIGAGVAKAAYQFNGSFVVKLNAQNGFIGSPQKNPPKWITQFNARGPRTYKAGKYIIQELVTVLTDTPEWKDADARRKCKWYQDWKAMYRYAQSADDITGRDVHEKNCGIDKNGQLVVFDW